MLISWRIKCCANLSLLHGGQVVAIVIAMSALAGCAVDKGLNGGLGTVTGSIGSLEAQSERATARAHFKRGAYGLAEKHYRLAIEANRKDAEAWLGLAASYDHLRRFDLADRAYDKLRSLVGDNAILLNNLGYSETLRGNYVEAAKLLARARRKAPDNAQVHRNIEFLEQRLAAAGK